jgi:hypothetical protein
MDRCREIRGSGALGYPLREIEAHIGNTKVFEHRRPSGFGFMEGFKRELRRSSLLVDLFVFCLWLLAMCFV